MEEIAKGTLDLELGIPEMTTIHRRPTKLLAHLQTSAGVYVQCRLSSGEDVHVSLQEIFKLFKKQLELEVRMSDTTRG
jgi:hypothetical protein